MSTFDLDGVDLDDAREQLESAFEAERRKQISRLGKTALQIEREEMAAALEAKLAEKERHDDAKKLEVAIRQVEAERNKVTGVAQWGDRIIQDPPAIPMLQPIDRVPRNGKVIMVYCPGETPEHVAAIWASAKNEDGGIAWEGLMFAEPLLADVCPDGPQNATHWYYPPTVDTRMLPHSGGRIDVDAFRKEYEATFKPRAPHEEFTHAQRSELFNRGIKPEDVKVYWLEEIEAERLTDFTSGSIFDDGPIMRRVTKRPCPVLTDFRPKNNQAYIVYPAGDIGMVELGEQTL